MVHINLFAISLVRSLKRSNHPRWSEVLEWSREVKEGELGSVSHSINKALKKLRNEYNNE
jgi:hypothetical protein